MIVSKKKKTRSKLERKKNQVGQPGSIGGPITFTAWV